MWKGEEGFLGKNCGACINVALLLDVISGKIIPFFIHCVQDPAPEATQGCGAL